MLSAQLLAAQVLATQVPPTIEQSASVAQLVSVQVASGSWQRPTSAQSVSPEQVVAL